MIRDALHAIGFLAAFAWLAIRLIAHAVGLGRDPLEERLVADPRGELLLTKEIQLTPWDEVAVVHGGLNIPEARQHHVR